MGEDIIYNQLLFSTAVLKYYVITCHVYYIILSVHLVFLHYFVVFIWRVPCQCIYGCFPLQLLQWSCRKIWVKSTGTNPQQNTTKVWFKCRFLVIDENITPLLLHMKLFFSYTVSSMLRNGLCLHPMFLIWTRNLPSRTISMFEAQVLCF